MYGSEIKDSILQNIGQTSGGLSSKVHFESRIMQLMFLVILACHIPFLFFSGKEALLMIVDELYRRRISKNLSN
jgi:hypothetical protein